MRTKTNKTVFRVFLDLSGQKEERWLEHMARQGWFLTKIPVLFYRFRKGEPGDWVYRLDFHHSHKLDRAEYLSLFKDAGWEYVAGSWGRFYFRTPAGLGRAPEIFTDNDSRIALYKRIVSGLGLFLAVLLLQISNMLTNRFHRGSFWLIVLIMASAIALTLAFGLFGIFVRIHRLKKGRVSPAPINER